MTAATEKSFSRWKAASLLGAVTFFSLIYFYEGGGWNQNSRFDLLRAIVEQHTLQIDAYHQNTQDKAHFKGHYYSDKAPGLVFLAVPVALAAGPVLRVAAIDPESARGEYVLSWLVTALVVALPTALAGICLFFLALKFGCSSIAAAFATVVMCVGTPIWAYGSVFWAHALVGACLVFAFASAVKLRESERAGADFGWALAVGLAAGWATVTEYPAAPASAILAFLALGQVWRRGNAARWRVIAGVGLGAAVCLVVLLSYLHEAFGSFRPSYSYYDPSSFSFMQQQGYMGLTYPHPDRLLKILFGCSRGLLFASPVVVAAPVGLWLLGRRSTEGSTEEEKSQRAGAVVVAAIAAYYFLFNASFYWWKSGLSFGPRYAGACIPLLCVGLAVAWQRAIPAWRSVLAGLAGLAACSVLVALMAVSTTSQLAMQDSCPIVHSSWSAFWAGDLAMNRQSMLQTAEAGGGYGAFNLGQMIGLHGIASLIPLVAMWGVMVGIWVRICRAR